MSSETHHDNRERRRRSRGWPTPSLGTVVTTAVVAYGTYQIASWAWNNWNNNNRQSKDDDQNENLTNVYSTHRQNSTQGRNSYRSDAHNGTSARSYRLRRQRMDRCRGETIKAMEDFLPTLRRTVEAATNTLAETQELKRLREERRMSTSKDEGTDSGSRLQAELKERETELWDVIKVQSVTRTVATAYAHTILFLVLTVQVNLLGGRLLQEQTNDKQSSSMSRNSSESSAASDRIDSYQASHRMVLLKTYEFFFDRGIVALVQTVRRAVSSVLADISVSDPSSLRMTRETFERIITDIRNVLEGKSSTCAQTRSRKSRPLSLLRFLLPPEAGLEASVPDELARCILDETWDLLESPVLEDAQRDCLGVTFELMRDHGWGNIFAADPYDESQTRWTTKPLANVVIQLKHTSKSFFEQGLTGGEFSAFGPRAVVNAYLGAMEMLPSVLELADVSFG